MSLSFGGRSVLARFLGFVWGLGMWLLLEISSYFEEFQVVLRVSDTFIMMHVQSSCNTFIYDIVHLQFLFIFCDYDLVYIDMDCTIPMSTLLLYYNLLDNVLL